MFLFSSSHETHTSSGLSSKVIIIHDDFTFPAHLELALPEIIMTQLPVEVMG